MSNAKTWRDPFAFQTDPMSPYASVKPTPRCQWCSRSSCIWDQSIRMAWIHLVDIWPASCSGSSESIHILLLGIPQFEPELYPAPFDPAVVRWQFISPSKSCSFLVLFPSSAFSTSHPSWTSTQLVRPKAWEQLVTNTVAISYHVFLRQVEQKLTPSSSMMNISAKTPFSSSTDSANARLAISGGRVTYLRRSNPSAQRNAVGLVHIFWQGQETLDEKFRVSSRIV